jgi:hypothetical protein
VAGLEPAEGLGLDNLPLNPIPNRVRLPVFATPGPGAASASGILPYRRGRVLNQAKAAAYVPPLV